VHLSCDVASGKGWCLPFSPTNEESENALNNILLLYTHSLLLPTAFPMSHAAEGLWTSKPLALC
jgi:hypothetical protein